MVYEYYIKSIGLHHERKGVSLVEDYSQLIAMYAEEGWRFVQLVNFSELSPNEQRIDLVFEREKKNRK